MFRPTINRGTNTSTSWLKIEVLITKFARIMNLYKQNATISKVLYTLLHSDMERPRTRC